MSTQQTELEAALSGLPTEFKDKLIDVYVSVKQAYAEAQYDACGLRSGKYCEILLRVLQNQLTGSFTPFGTKISNFTDECRNLANLPKASGSESLRVILPRAIDYVYTLRNKRDIGHVGGDVDANQTDSAACVRIIDWSMAELIRLYHGLSIEEAQELIDSLVTRQLPIVWEVGGIKRVLRTGLTLRDQSLCLLYSEVKTSVPVEDLVRWVDVKRLSDFKSRVILPLHKGRLVEYDRLNETVTLSPTGATAAEKIILGQLHLE